MGVKHVVGPEGSHCCADVIAGAADIPRKFRSNSIPLFGLFGGFSSTPESACLTAFRADLLRLVEADLARSCPCTDGPGDGGRELKKEPTPSAGLLTLADCTLRLSTDIAAAQRQTPESFIPIRKSNRAAKRLNAKLLRTNPTFL